MWKKINTGVFLLHLFFVVSVLFFHYASLPTSPICYSGPFRVGRQFRVLASSDRFFFVLVILAGWVVGSFGHYDNYLSLFCSEVMDIRRTVSMCLRYWLRGPDVLRLSVRTKRQFSALLVWGIVGRWPWNCVLLSNVLDLGASVSSAWEKKRVKVSRVSSVESNRQKGGSRASRSQEGNDHSG